MLRNPTAIVAVAWFLLALPALLIANQILRKRWLLEESVRYWGLLAAAIVFVGLVWLAVLFVLAPTLIREVPWKGLLVMAGLVGLLGGDLALIVGNGLGQSSASEFVGIHAVEFVGVRVRFEVMSGPQKGRMFGCSRELWYAVENARPFVIHPGRLGLWWGEFLES
jgi:hypothetical protein